MSHHSMSNIIVERQGQAGYITLDRPTALNSLTHEMIGDIHAGIRVHEADESVDVIVIRSSSERAFCAGGDMKATRIQALAEQWGELNAFFEEEYALNLHIGQCAKPYVSLVNGIAMGGGLGLSVHGDVLVVSETARLAMPETAIGFFPDVGGTHFLSRLAYDAGLWLGLTGVPVKGAQAVAVGLATHYVPSAHWPKLTDALETQGRKALDSTLADLNEYEPDEMFIKVLQQRKDWFNSDSQTQLLKTLEQASASDDDAALLLSRIKAVSPYAMDTTRQLLIDAKNHDLAACLQLELTAAAQMVKHPDFVEGIRAVLVDKDKAVWSSHLPAIDA